MIMVYSAFLSGIQGIWEGKKVKKFEIPDHEPSKEAFDAIGDTFLVDYVRVFDRK